MPACGECNSSDVVVLLGDDATCFTCGATGPVARRNEGSGFTGGVGAPESAAPAQDEPRPVKPRPRK